MTQLKIFRTHPLVKLPAKQTIQSACFDLSFQGFNNNTYEGYSSTNKAFKRPMNNQIVIQPGDRVAVPTGLIMDIPEGYSVRLHARSGMSLKQGLILANGEGVVDSDYVQEVMVLVHNISSNQIVIKSGDRIAQAELVEDVKYSIIESAARPGVKTNRTGGMGSTGVFSEGSTIIIDIKEPPPSILLEKKTVVSKVGKVVKAPVKKVAKKKPPSKVKKNA
jgi:dUTP pyrophosphatase